MMLTLMLCVAIGVGAEKPESPREKREAAIAAVKERMQPIEKRLAQAADQLQHAKAATVNMRRGNASKDKGKYFVRTNYRTEADKKADIAKISKEVEAIQEELKPLQAELKELQKPPKPEKPNG